MEHGQNKQQQLIESLEKCKENTQQQSLTLPKTTTEQSNVSQATEDAFEGRNMRAYHQQHNPRPDWTFKSQTLFQYFCLTWD